MIALSNKIGENNRAYPPKFERAVAPVLILSAQDKRLKEIKSTLSSFFNILACDYHHPDLDYILSKPLKAIVIDDSIPIKNILKILKGINNRNIPTLGISYVVNNDFSKILKDIKNTHILSHPFNGSQMIKTLSKAINIEIQKRWNKLNKVNKEALEGCLDLFTHIPDIVNSSSDITFDDVTHRVGTVIESVEYGIDDELLSALKGIDNYTISHSFRVAVFMSYFGANIGIKSNDLKLLTAGGLLHDIGKLFIPYHILNKGGPLSPSEEVIMKSHVSRTSHILKNKMNVPREILLIAEQHHERLDGSGYPQGLQASQLNDIVRIAAIADIFCTMTDEQPFSKAYTVEKTLNIMRSMTEKIDQHFLSVFAEVIMDRVH